jgi:hypothetical protein
VVGQHVPLNPDLVAGRWTTAQRAADVHVRFQDLRHLSVSVLLSAGIGVADTARRHGHSPEVMLERYAHALPSADERAAAITGDLARRIARSS